MFMVTFSTTNTPTINNHHQVTTIITTHYVDEARGANRVGFMRGGKLLAEDSPQVKMTMKMMMMM